MYIDSLSVYAAHIGDLAFYRWTTTVNFEDKSSLPLSGNSSLPLSGNSSFHSIPSKASITGSENQDKLINNIPLSADSVHYANNIPPIVDYERVSWSDPVNPVPTSSHAPFLTMRGQPRQRTLHSIFEGEGTNGQSFRGRYNSSFSTKDILMDSRYSKYGTVSENTTASQM